MGSVKTVDVSWLKHQCTDDIWPRWLEAAVLENGAYHTDFNREWSPKTCDTCTLVSQSRLSTAFSMAYLVTHETVYRDAAAMGLEFLLRALRDREHGGYFWSCNSRGTLVSDAKNSYGHAYLVLALSYGFIATREQRYLKYALRVSNLLTSRFRDQDGGLVHTASRTWRDMDIHRSQNPIMHSVEGLAGLLYALGTPCVEDADYVETYRFELVRDMCRLIDFALKLRDPTTGLMPELMDMYWTPLLPSEGGAVFMGHQFMWAWLLSFCSDLGLPAHYLSVGEQLLERAIAHGFDPGSGAVCGSVVRKGRKMQGNILWWEQVEAIRTLMHYTLLRQRNDLVPQLRSMLSFCDRHFVDREYGGWYFALGSDAQPFQPDKGTPWKVDYHQSGACFEAIRLQDVVATQC